MASSEIPPQGERDADCIWNNEAFTKSLDVVPRALFSRRHQLVASPSGGWTLASLPSARHTLTRTGGRRGWPATAAGDLFDLCVIPLYRCWQTFGQEIAATSAPRWPRDFEKQVIGYGLTTAQILYRRPDHRWLLQSYIWQDYDLFPNFPELQRFLAFWQEKLEGPLHSVQVAHQKLIKPAELRAIDGVFRLH